MLVLPEELIDIDDVMVKHVEGFIAWNNAQEWAGEKQLTFEDYTEFWDELWGVDAEEGERRRRLFFTPEIVGAFEVVEEARLFIPKLAEVRRLTPTTARRESLKGVTEFVLDHIAPGCFTEVICTTYFEDGQKIRLSKADICVERGAEGVIDDQLKTCLGVAAVDKRAILFGEYPWNRSTQPLPDNVIPLPDWYALGDHFGVIA